jgi:hypothetical protein
MSLAALIRSMADAGAPPEAIALAVEAVEAAEAKVEAGRAAARERKRRQRDKGVTVTGQSRDTDVTVTAETPSLPSSPQTPQQPTHPRGDISPVREEPVRSTPLKAKATRRCPEGWSPRPSTTATLEAEGYDPGTLERALAMVRDHEFRTARTDWDATYRNWVRNEPPKAPNERHRHSQPTARESRLERMLAGAERAVGP